MTSSPVALFFYHDHCPETFIEFQMKYLDNVLVKFLYAKGLLLDYHAWTRTDTVVAAKANDVLAYDPLPFLVSNPDEMVETCEHLGLKKETPMSVSRDDVSFVAYVNEVMIVLKKFCNASGELARDLSASDERPELKWTHDAELGVYVHPRYSGSILIKGRIGERPVVFGYTPSIKFDAPCCAAECIFDTNAWKWGEETSDAMAQYRCEKIGIIHKALIFPEKNAGEKKKRKRPKDDQIPGWGGKIWWMNDGTDLEEFLGEDVPSELKAILG